MVMLHLVRLVRDGAPQIILVNPPQQVQNPEHTPQFTECPIESGPNCEVFFPQTHVPGEQGQSDFTDMRELEVVIAGDDNTITKAAVFT